MPIVRLEASAKIVATGIKTIKASQASGTLTIYNGSRLEESLRVGFIVTTQSGIEIQTDQAVVIPAANPPAFGMTTVPAHAVEAGSQGNIAAEAINQEDGSTITIKNLVPFTGGRDAHIIHAVQDTDREAAIAMAKARVEAEKPTNGLLAQPCMETVKQSETQVTVQQACQYVTYHAPAGARVLSTRVEFCVAIDLGVTNLAAITSNREGFIPRLVNGRPLKALNQWYNKRMKELTLCLPKGERERVTKQMERITNKRNRQVNHSLLDQQGNDGLAGQARSRHDHCGQKSALEARGTHGEKQQPELCPNPACPVH